MNIKVQKWENDQAIRLPKYILNSVGLQENDSVSVAIEDNKIILEKQTNSKHIPLKERLLGFKGDYQGEEWNTGEAVGSEQMDRWLAVREPQV